MKFSLASVCHSVNHRLRPIFHGLQHFPDRRGNQCSISQLFEIFQNTPKVIQAEGKDRHVPYADKRDDRSGVEPMAQCYKTQDDDLFGNPDESSSGIPLSAFQSCKGPRQVIHNDKNEKPFNCVINRAKKKGAQGSQNPANCQKYTGREVGDQI